ncbi:MAG: hypothetical protein K6G26_08660 [Lachnospiraceae bacterium]|nr:hypothetical protein [Lachnospiraceae bacterium]
MGDKKKFKIFVWIMLILAVVGNVVITFMAPVQGTNGLIASISKKACFVVAAILIVTAFIKHKSLTNMDKISKYIALGVILYALIAVVAGYIGVISFKDFKKDKETLTLNISDYDVYRSEYGKLGTLYHLNATINDEQQSFLINEETYKSIKEVTQIELEYYKNNMVVSTVKCNDAYTIITNSVTDAISDVSNNIKDKANNIIDSVTNAVNGIKGEDGNNNSGDAGNLE